MKNLLIYVHPQGFFDEESAKLVKIQIDNSFRLGWKKKDIILVTNFPHEYNGVKSLVIDGSNFCQFRPLSTKTVTVAYLLEHGMIKKGELYWAHDLDAYQSEVITESELELDTADVGFTTYGWIRKWCMGSYFFKKSSEDIFGWIRKTIYEIQNEDERALVSLTRNNTNNINERYKILNITYNFGMRRIDSNYGIAEKPLKVLHFHPWGRRGMNPLSAFMYGKNELHIPLMSKGLIEIFNNHGIK